MLELKQTQDTGDEEEMRNILPSGTAFIFSLKVLSSFKGNVAPFSQISISFAIFSYITQTGKWDVQR